MIDEAILETERALVFLEAWGSTTSTDEPWEGYARNLQGYAPEWLSRSDLGGADPDSCVTVLAAPYSEVEETPEHWRIAYQYSQEERECPWCGGEWPVDEEKRKACELCDGDGYLYDPCQVVVFAPEPVPVHWTSGSGMVGCLYDNGPHVSETKEQAIEGLLFTFDNLGKASLARMRRDLEAAGSHYFDRRIRPFAGADYCEISECDCQEWSHLECED